MSEDVPDALGSVGGSPAAARNQDTAKPTSNKLLTGMVVAIAAAAFFAGYSTGIFTDSDDGISDEQMELILSEIDSMMAVPVDEKTDQSGTHAARVSLDDDPIKGNPDAEITIVEFSDFQCPFCARFYEQTLPLIEQEYIDTGKVNLVYRDFPLQIHRNAVPAHIASECADEQGQFWPYHDMLFEKQKEWGSLPDEVIISQLLQYADDLGLEPDDFGSCLESAMFAQEIQNDYQDGVQYGVRGTPAFFVGNEQDGYVILSGAQPFGAFQSVIESMLE